MIEGADITGTLTDGKKFYTYSPYDPSMVETLRKNGVKVEARPEDTSSSTFWGVVVSWFPMILLIGVWVYFMRQARFYAVFQAFVDCLCISDTGGAVRRFFYI